MKLVEDDGEQVMQIDDDCTLMIAHPNGDVSGLIPKMGKGDEVVPPHVVFTAALLAFLREDENRQQVMRYAPRRRGKHYKAN